MGVGATGAFLKRPQQLKSQDKVEVVDAALIVDCPEKLVAGKRFLSLSD